MIIVIAGVVPESKGKVEEEGAYEEGPRKAGA